MKKAASLSFLSALALTAFVGCAAPEEDTQSGESGEATATDDVVAASNFGYFAVTRIDMRKCAAPACGGVYVKRVNDEKTACADGSFAAECYVDAITLNGIGLSAREADTTMESLRKGQAIVKARTYRRTVNGQTFGTLKASEAWVGALGTSAAKGTIYRVASSGIRCIKAPCPSQVATELNGDFRHLVTDVDFNSTRAIVDPNLLDLARNALWSDAGVLIAGGVALPKCAAGATNCGPKAIAQDFFLRVTHTEGVACGGRGNSACSLGQFCSWKAGDICGAADAPGKCSWKPEACPMVYLPVCGCDGQTYSNDCVAASVGASVSTEGACAP